MLQPRGGGCCCRGCGGLAPDVALAAQRRFRSLSSHLCARTATTSGGGHRCSTPLPHGWQTPPATSSTSEGFRMTEEQKYQMDLNGFFLLKSHYTAQQVAEFHRGIDELQAIPVEHTSYAALGVAHPGLHRLQADPAHEVWQRDRAAQLAGQPPRRLDMAICGTDKLDQVVRDPVLRAIHTELAGGPCMLSATYFIEKQGPQPQDMELGLHFGGFPRQRNFHYEYDHREGGGFRCFSTKATIILTDMSTIEQGPFSCIPGFVLSTSALRAPPPELRSSRPDTVVMAHPPLCMFVAL
jgi:hypothetical protein